MRCSVRVVEAGQHRAAVRVDDRRLRAAQALDFTVGADAQDLVAADGERLGELEALPVYTRPLVTMRSTGPLSSSRCAPTMRPATSVPATIRTTMNVVSRDAM